MKQINLIDGSVQDGKMFKDIKNQNPTTAEQKAHRLLVLGKLINTVPNSVKNGSIQTVRAWRDARDKCVKVSKNHRSSLNEIESCISRMRSFEKDAV